MPLYLIIWGGGLGWFLTLAVYVRYKFHPLTFPVVGAIVTLIILQVINFIFHLFHGEQYESKRNALPSDQDEDCQLRGEPRDHD